MSRGRKAPTPFTFPVLQHMLNLRKVHIRGDGYCWGRFFLFMFAQNARNTCFVAKESVDEKLSQGGAKAAAKWVPTKHMLMCAPRPPPTPQTPLDRRCFLSHADCVRLCAGLRPSLGGMSGTRER